MNRIPMKPYKVRDPRDGKVHLVYAQTTQGAIRDVRAALEDQQEWTAVLASGEDLYLAARTGQRIINPPATIGIDVTDAPPSSSCR